MASYLVSNRQVLRQMLQDQLDARAAAEVRVEVVTGSDAVVRPRVERGHRRLLATTLGRRRPRSPNRAPSAANLHPGDAALALPRQVYCPGCPRPIGRDAVRVRRGP